MRVWFYHPPGPLPYGPLFLMPILLEAGIDARLVSSRGEMEDADDRDVLCISAVFSKHLSDFDSAATWRPWKRIVLGGVAAAGMGHDFWAVRWKHSRIVLVHGYGELGILPAVRGQDRVAEIYPKQPTPSDIPMPAYDLIDLAAYDMGYETQTHDLWKGLDSGLSYEAWRVPTGLVQTSRGCPFRCTFCTNTMYGQQQILFDPGRVVREMRDLGNRGVRWLMMGDANFGSPRRHLEAVCRAIVDAGVDTHWNCEGTAISLDHKLMELMLQAGCFNLRFGLESASPAVRREYRKTVSLDRLAQNIKIAREVGLPIHANVIVGARCETDDTVMDTIRFLNENRVDYFLVTYLTVYAGTHLFREICRETETPYHSRETLRRWVDMIQTRVDGSCQFGEEESLRDSYLQTLRR